ncbi:MAG: CoA ester lyase [Proteobacteria bacterium]|nr:CoA ester lyase [Pseudomonadota bacterium]
MTLIRSFLFAPGNVARRVEKALTLDCDAVIIDLEDSVGLSDKAATRPIAAEALRRPRRGLGYLRVNAASTGFCLRDLTETLHAGVDGVIIPKVESAAELHAIDWLIENIEREQGIAIGSIDLVPIIETAIGVQRVDRILQARSLRRYAAPWRVHRVAFGAADFGADMGLEPTLDEPELADARARIVLASRAAGLPGPIDSPWFHFKETEAFARSLERSVRSGFQGRLCVHPDQIAAVNAAYAPTAEEVVRARKIVDAFAAAEREGSAAIQVEGQMVDYPVMHRARAVLDAQAAIDARNAGKKPSS